MSRRFLDRSVSRSSLPALSCGAAFGLGLIAFASAVAAEPAPTPAPGPGARTRPAQVPPLPPPRPAEFRAPAAPAAAPPPPPPPAGLDQNVEDGRGFRPLPAASRARMRTCGDEWRRMKLEGAARDKNWRDFADVCLRQ